jgi:integrase
MLKEPEGVTRELQVGEEAALEEAMRSDYAPWVEFALLSGLRRDETLISWSEVDWHNRLIRTVGKRGKLLTVPISDAVAAILEEQKGKHEEAVFTYVAQRTVKSRNLIKGVRYPITYAGGKTEWRRLVARANVKDFRFHDLRHTFGSRLLRETGNLALVQKAMNHSDVKTTSRYAHVNQADLTQAVQAVAEKRKPWKSKSTPKSTPDDPATKSTD